MCELSRGGVCYDIRNTPFYCDWRGFRFYFSSSSHLQKFLDNASGRESWLTDSLSRRFHCGVDASLLAVFQLYNQVESRGFYVVDSVTGHGHGSMGSLAFKVDFRRGIEKGV